jgi:uncharacterized membrane-anchored protein
MLRRIITVLAVVALIGAVSALVYFNVEETTFRLTPQHSFTLPLGVLMLAAAVAGGLFMFLLALAREGRHALRDWRVQREKRVEERNVELRRQARSLTLAGDHQRARALFAKAAKRRAPDVVDVIDYASTYILEGRASEARRILEEGQKDFGNDPLLLYALARACSESGDKAAALSTLERALSVYPSSRDILRMLRDLLFDSGQWQRATEVQSRLLDLDPQNVREQRRLLGARYEAAVTLEGEPRAAALKAIIASHPDFIPALVARADDLEAAGEDRQAFKLLEKAARRRPHPAILDLLEARTPGDQSQRLVKLYAKLTSAAPEDEALRLRAARFLLASGRIDEAARELEATSGDAHAYAKHALWAEVHRARSNGDLAQAAYHEAITAEGTKPAAYRCAECGRGSLQWQPRCGHCGAWDAIDAAA